MSTCLIGLLGTLNDIIQIKNLEYSTCGKPSVNVILLITVYGFTHKQVDQKLWYHVLIYFLSLSLPGRHHFMGKC